MKQRKVVFVAFVLVLAVMLMACPSTSQRQQAATAAQQASAVIAGFEQGEIVAYQQGVIPKEDHLLIQEYMLTIARSGKATDACILASSSNAGIVTCVNTALNTIDQLNAEGGLHLKSPTAQRDFQLAMIGTRTALAVIVSIMGGK